MRRQLALGPVAAVLLAFAAACGGGDEGAAPGTRAEAATRLVPFAEFKSVPLDTPRADVLSRFGTPLRSEPAGELDPGATCIFYPAAPDAAPATEYQLCFIGGKLHSKFAG